MTTSCYKSDNDHSGCEIHTRHETTQFCQFLALLKKWIKVFSKGSKPAPYQAAVPSLNPVSCFSFQILPCSCWKTWNAEQPRTICKWDHMQTAACHRLSCCTNFSAIVCTSWAESWKTVKKWIFSQNKNFLANQMTNDSLGAFLRLPHRKCMGKPLIGCKCCTEHLSEKILIYF